MSDYSDLMSSLNPVRWARCDELLPGVFTDSSSFAQHGTTQPDAVFGLPSAIETDPASSSIGGPAGNFPAAAGEEADLKGNFTILWWQWYDASNPSGVAWGRRGQLSLSHSVQGGINEGSIFADITLDNGGIGDYFPLVAEAVLVDQSWYMCALVRNATVARLYVNADLGQGKERMDLTTADVDYNVEGSDWFIGRSFNTTAFASSRTDEAVFLNYAIDQALVTLIYETALNALFLNGVSNVIPTAILRSDFEPDPVSFPFRHNWSEPLIERLSFRSDISQSVTGVEEGNGLRITPRRELEFTQLLRNDRERRKLRAFLWANQHRKWFIPVRQYAEQLLTPLSATDTTAPISTQYKDYEVNSWIGFRQYDGSGNVEHSEERLITSLAPLEFEPLVHDYAAYRSIVYPVRRGLLPRSISVKGHTDAVEEVTLTARLLPEDEAIIPNRTTLFTPTLKYRDVELFDGRVWQSNDWSENREYEIERDVQDLDFDNGLIGVESDTAGASETFSYRMVLNGHENIAAFLGWYYERLGALRYLWVPTMQRDFDIISVAGDELTVRDTDYSDAYALAEPRRDLAFVYFDGTIITRRVLGFAGVTDETLTLDADVPTLVSLRCLSLLKYCRLDADQLELAWETDNKVIVAWRFREPLHTPEGEGVSSLSPSASQSVSLSPSHSPSPSASLSRSPSPSSSISPSSSLSPSSSTSRSNSPSLSPSHSASPSA